MEEKPRIRDRFRVSPSESTLPLILPLLQPRAARRQHYPFREVIPAGEEAKVWKDPVSPAARKIVDKLRRHAKEGASQLAHVSAPSSIVLASPSLVVVLEDELDRRRSLGEGARGKCPLCPHCLEGSVELRSVKQALRPFLTELISKRNDADLSERIIRTSKIKVSSI